MMIAVGMNVMIQYDVMIPVYCPDEKLHKLIAALKGQTLKPQRIILVNTDREKFLSFSSEEEFLGSDERMELHHVTKEQFDHGGTRNYGVTFSHAPFFVCMTDDAIPADEYLMERLLAGFADERVGISYARQLPSEDCGTIERYTRSFNYPETGCLKTSKELPVMGIKTFFASNVCAAYRRSCFDELGGFPSRTIFNEDMIYARHLIDHGCAIAYTADAKVIHSHNYSGFEQLHRNFDLGVSHAQFKEEFEGITAESEGKKLVLQTCRYLCSIGKPWLIVKLVWQSGCKYIGYFLGKRYRRLPQCMVRWCSMNKNYWTE